MGSGGMDVEWEGLRIVRIEKWYVEREIEAGKGEGEGKGVFGECDALLVASVPARERNLDGVGLGVREGRPPL